MVAGFLFNYGVNKSWVDAFALARAKNDPVELTVIGCGNVQGNGFGRRIALNGCIRLRSKHMAHEAGKVNYEEKCNEGEGRKPGETKVETTKTLGRTQAGEQGNSHSVILHVSLRGNYPLAWIVMTKVIEYLAAHEGTDYKDLVNRNRD